MAVAESAGEGLVDDLRRGEVGLDRAGVRVAVAYSGGRDSTALLHAALRAAGTDGARIVAFHVHHGLSRNADAWLAHCQARCDEWSSGHPALRLVALRLSADRRGGESVEAWARRGRYRALSELAQAEGVDRVLLAHHRRDQAETVVLQALRGGGVRGVAAMPLAVRRDGVRFERPWLARSDDEIDRYVRTHALDHIVDESNVDRRYARNRLRLAVWPALERAFPQAEAALATSANWAQEAAAVLAEVAAEDLAACTDGRALSIERWLRLSPGRRSNALRAWLTRERGASGRATLTTRLLRELPLCRSGRWPATGGELCLAAGRLDWSASPGTAQTADARPGRDGRRGAVAGEADGPTGRTLDLAMPGVHAVPAWGGVLVVEAASAGEAGLPADLLRRVELRARAGGERFSLGAGRPARTLKKQFQARRLPAWERDGPLVFVDGRLAYVPGLGMAASLTSVEIAVRPMRLGWRFLGPSGGSDPASSES